MSLKYRIIQDPNSWNTEIMRLESHLRTLAAAVIEAHKLCRGTRSDDMGNGYMHTHVPKEWAEVCACPACQIARLYDVTLLQNESEEGK